ncbi:Aldehyde oxidase and xanthine dehydrogenase, molybdopterin binding [Pseudooceanicola batsensis HTCC2597]|uniref:Aldehyde oxidase and xanthine dehydrogenase, molybdopterin binding n=1 Tax=Pseudooceanicola batsensis (strain ATCC BAA-863 / DSM 15984 / KCTC 12145 / HTCC2597) TaxID=252305 RepID=A3TSR4_PSEBH|nr:molybdopterin cofactor-binding domain-containing protein [Pseudooceanicola batsensis]EAQ04691.1 Aldehyde oxidase and xanthine dehydrogenase, molybdopterin binding [Pseudooceanicola batsensis HTCC2597]
MTDGRTLADPGRRRLLRLTGWAAAGVAVAAAAWSARGAVPAMPTLAGPEPDEALTWIQMLPDGRVRFFCPRAEMGQGAGLGLSQVVAGELILTQQEVELVRPDTSQVPPCMLTVGSDSLRLFFGPVSRAAALLREHLRDRAAAAEALAPGDLAPAMGGFTRPDGAHVPYAALVSGDPLVLDADAGPPPRDDPARDGTASAVGAAWAHPELEDIVTGRAIYSRDVAREGMLYGAVAHPPSLGARLQGGDRLAARSLPGVIDAVVDTGADFAGVVAHDPFLLVRALEALGARWAEPAGAEGKDLLREVDLARLRKAGDFEHVLVDEGSDDRTDAPDDRAASAMFTTAMAAHAAMEPRAAVADVRADKVEIWCGTQDPYFVRARIASLLGRATESVVIHPQRMGGAFGGRVACGAAEQAARLSAAVGRPVRVQWSREDEFRNGYMQPPFAHRVSARVTAEGRLTSWKQDFVSAPITTGPVSALGGGLSRVIAAGIDRFSSDAGTARGAVHPYAAATRRIRYSDIRTPVPFGPWRGLGAGPNTFVTECVMDELAEAAAMDPCAFRLRNFAPGQERLAHVLNRVAALSGWRKGTGRATSATARGIACGSYKGMTHVAAVAEVETVPARREVRVRKVWCVQDCGRVVNPDQVRAMVMGNIVWGCGMVLRERLTLEGTRIAQDNFDTYEIMRNEDCPEVEIELVPSEEPPAGAGESALVAVAPAIANAVHAATGQRIRRLPLRAEDVFPEP